MRHSNGNDMAKQACRIRRATQLALLTGGVQDEHPCAAAPWAGARSEPEGASLLYRIICGNLAGFCSGVIAGLDCCRAVMVCLCVHTYPCLHIAPQ